MVILTVGAVYFNRRGFYPPHGSPLIYAIAMSWFIAITVAVPTSAIFKVNPKLFSLARWEKEGEIYDRTSIRAFRWVVLHSPLGWINPSLYLGASRTDCERLLREMNVSEEVHWLTCFLSSILAIACLVAGYAVYGYAMLLIRVPFDLYPIMLHRRNRGRVCRMLSRQPRTSRVAAIARNVPINQCSQPSGWLGRLNLWRMNKSHSKLTDWGLGHVSIQSHDTILDIGCGGGRTVSKLAAIATQGRVVGVDYSETSVETSSKTNVKWIDTGRVEIRQGSVSQLPFADSVFDLITAVETHFWWPNLPNDLREVFRVIKPGGMLILIAEVYKGANSPIARLLEEQSARIGLQLLTAEEHRELLAKAGFSDIQINLKEGTIWLSATGKRPLASS
jgi:SAM-dependent methyltransferase